MDQSEEQGLRQIGNLAPMIEKLRQGKGIPNSRLIALPSASETSGSGNRGKGDANLTGRQRGEITLEGTSPAVRLEEQSPPLVDRWIKGQLPPRVALLIATAEILDPDYNVVGYGPISLTEAELLQVREILAPMCVPMDFEEVVKRLTRARSLTKRRADKGDDEEMTLGAYAELFMDYPADVAALVLTKLHRLDGGWWPDGARVEKELAWYGKGRVELWRAVNQ